MWAKKSPEDSKGRVKSSFIWAAQKLGFLNDEQAEAVERLFEEDLEHASQDIVVRAGILTQEQAHAVEEARKSLDIEGHLLEQFKRASLAVGDAKASAEELVDVTLPKKVGVG